MRVPGSRYGHALQPRDVHQDAAREDAVLGHVDRVPRMALGEHRLVVVDVAVVRHAVVRAVGQRVDVGVGEPVVAQREPVERGAGHVPFVGARAGDAELRIGVALVVRPSRERDGEALLHQGRRLPALGARDQVERAVLVVVAPTAPVGQLLLPGLDVGRGHRLGLLAAALRDQHHGRQGSCERRQQHPAQHDSHGFRSPRCGSADCRPIGSREQPPPVIGSITAAAAR